MGKIEIVALIVLIIVLLFVGAKKLPELARGIGQSAKELKKGFAEEPEDNKTSADNKTAANSTDSSDKK